LPRQKIKNIHEKNSRKFVTRPLVGEAMGLDLPVNPEAARYCDVPTTIKKYKILSTFPPHLSFCG